MAEEEGTIGEAEIKTGEAEISLPDPTEAEIGEEAVEGEEASQPKVVGAPVTLTPHPIVPARSIGREAEELGGVQILRTAHGKTLRHQGLHNER